MSRIPFGFVPFRSVPFHSVPFHSGKCRFQHLSFLAIETTRHFPPFHYTPFHSTTLHSTTSLTCNFFSCSAARCVVGGGGLCAFLVSCAVVGVRGVFLSASWSCAPAWVGFRSSRAAWCAFWAGLRGARPFRPAALLLFPLPGCSCRAGVVPLLFALWARLVGARSLFENTGGVLWRGWSRVVVPSSRAFPAFAPFPSGRSVFYARYFSVSCSFYK